MKLWTDVDLLFGEFVVKQGNMAEDYPGVYSLWLKKAGDGWRMAVNSLPDVWGTMYDPKADIGEIPLHYDTQDASNERLTVTLTEDGDGADLKLAWGTHIWTAKVRRTP